MDLTEGYSYPFISAWKLDEYPKLQQSIKTDVAIIGGGISGALTAYYLTKSGIDCMLIDSRIIGLGSTSASTSLLQYELDKPLSELSLLIGKRKAERAYELCSEAIDKIEQITGKIEFNEFERCDSLFFAAQKKDITLVNKEYESRKKAGFKVDLLDEKEISKKFGLIAPTGILSKQGAITNAYKLTNALLKNSISKGLQVFERTKVAKIKYSERSVELHTENGYIISAKNIVNATGYEITEFIDKNIIKLSSTYAIASEKMDDAFLNKTEQTIMWNTADPYLYMRSTKEGRVIIGGRDEDFYNPELRDKLIKKKAGQLSNDFNKLFPGTKFNPEYSWTGTFGSTKDSLPYIGKYDKTPQTYYALGFGGNGITFSLIAARMIRDMIIEKRNKDTELFSFKR